MKFNLIQFTVFWRTGEVPNLEHMFGFQARARRVKGTHIRLFFSDFVRKFVALRIEDLCKFGALVLQLNQLLVCGVGNLENYEHIS